MNLCSLVREAVDFTRSAFPKSITVTEVVHSPTALVMCNATQLHQVLVNICANAAQSIIDEGNISVTVDTPVFDSYACVDGTIFSGQHARVTISDTGAGMDDDILQHIFDPFFTTKKVGEGTGLGLSTVFGIVKAHEGGVNVRSKRGEGTTFEVFFPIAEAETPTFALEQEEPEQAGEHRILFVDDEKEINSFGKLGLGMMGYEVTTASDGEEAWKLVSASPDEFDLVLTDQNMPRMKGDVLAGRIKSLRPGLPVVLCTGYYGDSCPSNAAVGVDAIIYKPYLLSDLSKTIESLLDSAASARRDAQ